MTQVVILLSFSICLFALIALGETKTSNCMLTDYYQISNSNNEKPLVAVYKLVLFFNVDVPQSFSLHKEKKTLLSFTFEDSIRNQQTIKALQ